MRVLVCGGRTYENWRELSGILAKLHAEQPFSLVITGGAPGADRCGQRWAENQGIPVAVFPANWNRLGKKAGPIRNENMLQFGVPDVVVAFPGGLGTDDMISKAEAAKIAVLQPFPNILPLAQRNTTTPTPGQSRAPM